MGQDGRYRTGPCGEGEEGISQVPSCKHTGEEGLDLESATSVAIDQLVCQLQSGRGGRMLDADVP